MQDTEAQHPQPHPALAHPALASSARQRHGWFGQVPSEVAVEEPLGRRVAAISFTSGDGSIGGFLMGIMGYIIYIMGNIIMVCIYMYIVYDIIYIYIHKQFDMIS